MVREPSTFRLTATARDFPRYHSTFLANGYVSSVSSLRGTDATLTLVAALMDRTDGDVSHPAAIPSWLELDCYNGAAWLSQTPVSEAAFQEYAQTLEMRDGVLSTSYVWVAGGRAARVEVTTFISQTSPHLAATRLAVTPQFSGSVRFRFPLRAWPRPLRRFPLARLSWRELKEALVAGGAATPMPDTLIRPSPPREILTWFDLQEALAADGLTLSLPDPAAPTRAVIWYPGEVRPRFEADLPALLLGVEGVAAGGSGFALAVAVELPEGAPVTGRRVSDEGSGGIGIEVDVEAQPGRPCVVTKYASVSRDGWDGGLADDLARAERARREGFAALISAHTSAWHQLWDADVIVEGDAAFQRAIHADLFSLLQATHPGSPWPVGACGLSPNYFGHVFWDCDTWVMPALLLLHPDRARPLVAFRSRTLPWAQANAARLGLAGAAFPWEADPETGTEQTPAYARVNAEGEVHLQGDIAIAQWQYYLATGDRAWLREAGYPVIAAAADFYVTRATYDRGRDRYALRRVVSVDEKYTDVDDDAYTNAVAWTCLEIATAAAERLGLAPHPQWEVVAATLAPLLSPAERRHLVFDPAVPHDRRTWMAGALAMLTAPFLDLPMPEDVRRHDYDDAVRKVAELTVEPNQMMLAMLAVHAATLGDAEAASRWLQPAGLEFLKPPFHARSETPHNNTMPHLAASGGVLQAVIYGFTGLRLTEGGLIGAYPPVLPEAWEGLTLQGVRVRGNVLDVTVTRDVLGRVRLDRRAR